MMLHISFRHEGVLLFRTQLFLLLFPLIITPVLVVGSISYFVSAQALQNRSMATVESISTLVNQNINTTLQQMAQLAQMSLYNPDLLRIVTYYTQHPEISSLSISDATQLRDALSRIIIADDAIVSVDMYTEGHVTLSQPVQYTVLPAWKQQGWYNQVTLTSTRTLFLPTHQLPSDTMERLRAPIPVFSVVQTLVNLDTLQPVGVLVINIDARTIEQTIANSQGATDTKFLIYNDRQQRIYPVAAPENDLQFTNAVNHVIQQKEQKLTWQQSDYFVSSNTSALSNWTVVALVPTNSLLQDITIITRTTLFVSALVLLATLCLLLFFVTGVSSQVTLLRQLMQKVERGNLDVQFHHRGRSEIITLGQSFNRMVAQLKQLIQDKYEAQLQRQRAELAALQSQLNPHFLYNTLSSFQMLAISDGNDCLAEMSYALGQMMRYSLGVEEIGTLGREVEHLQNFLLLLKFRFNDRLHYQIDVPEALYDCLLPKLTLQPLVENAIYHGIDPKIEGGTVIIRGSVQNELLILEICDDGLGMTAETIQRLQEALSYDENFVRRSKHIGMLNIQRQLQRIFGPIYGLSLSAEENSGVTVRIQIPITREGVV